MQVLLTIAVLLGLLAASAGVAIWAWQEIGEVEMSWHGFIALGLGAGVALLLGGGLMALLFFSNRHGYDARAHQGDELPSPDERASGRRPPADRR